jgi:nitrogen regulatory protein PII
MKLLTVVLRPEQLPAVKQALFDVEIRHMTAVPVLGTASATEQSMYRGVRHEISLFKRLRLELALNDHKVETAMEAIAKGANETGGFGKIFVTELVDTMTIFSGERGERTLK